MSRTAKAIGGLSSSVDSDVRRNIDTIKEVLLRLEEEIASVSAVRGRAWSTVDKNGAKLTDIPDRKHADLQEIKSISANTNDTARDKHLSNADGVKWNRHLLEFADDTDTDNVYPKHVTNALVKKYEDHRLIIDGNPHGTDHAQLDAIAQADDTSSSATGGKHVTDALVKKYEDHRNASQDVHGIGASNSVVGTGTSQTISNKILDDSNKYGGATNCSKFETDGTLVFENGASVWADMQFQISSGKVGAANAPTWETFTANTSAYSFDVDDYIDLGANETHHGWKVGTDGLVHLHLAIKTAQSTGADRFAKFTIYLAYADVNEVWTETSLTAELTIPTGTAALTHNKLSMGTLTLTNNLFGTQVKPRIKRIAATGGTEYADSVFITQVGIHLEHDTVGSREASSK